MTPPSASRSPPDRSTPAGTDADGEGPAKRPGLFGALLVGLVLIHLVPIWGFKYFPTNDGPAHVANAWILHHLFSQDHRIYEEMYEVNRDPIPNWFTHLSLALLIFVAPPLIAEKIFLTAYVLIFVFSFLYFLSSFGRGRAWLVVLAFPFIYTLPLQLGFYNFTVGLPIGFFTLGFWWRRRGDALRPGFLVALNLLLTLLYFIHLLPMLLMLGSILLLYALENGRRIRNTVLFGLGLCPACILPLHFVVSRGVAGYESLMTPGTWKALLGLHALVAYSPRTYHVAAAIAVLFGLLVLGTILRDKIFCDRCRPRLQPRDGLLLLAIVFSVLYFVTPSSSAGGYVIKERISLFPFLVILPWLTIRFSARIKYAVGLAAVVLSITHVVITTGSYRNEIRVIENYTSGIPFISRNETVLALTFFDPLPFPDCQVRTLFSANGYYEFSAGAINLLNYEALTDHFPLRYRPEWNPARIKEPSRDRAGFHPWLYPRPVDQVVVYFPTGLFDHLASVLARYPDLAWVFKHYRPIHEQPPTWLLKRKRKEWPPRE